MPTSGSLGSLSPTDVPTDGFLGPTPVGEGIWIVRRLFSLGGNQTDGLRWEGLKERVLAMIADSGLNHPALTEPSESTAAELAEEVAQVGKLIAGEHVPFPLDSTMTIVRDSTTGGLTLHSVVEADAGLVAAVAALGSVSRIVAPNLQHWLFIEGWAAAHPDASILLAEPACGEDLHAKLADQLREHRGEVKTLPRAGDLGSELQFRLLEGNPLSLNEMLLYHTPSETLIATDSFYGGYGGGETPTWFARFWFKLTKAGSFRGHRLPVYRTARAVSDGDPAKLLECVQEMNRGWEYRQIVFAHGTSPYTAERLALNNAGAKGAATTVPAQYEACWRDGLAAVTKKATPKPLLMDGGGCCGESVGATNIKGR